MDTFLIQLMNRFLKQFTTKGNLGLKRIQTEQKQLGICGQELNVTCNERLPVESSEGKQYFKTLTVSSRVAQWKRAGPITQRSEDQNLALLKLANEFFHSFLFVFPCRRS